jgi:riboflavin synthase
MFTGIIVEVGAVASATMGQGSLHLTIDSPDVAPQLAVHDSICVDGVCLTVTGSQGRSFEVQAVEETLKKTTLGALRRRDKVNLEPALRVGDRLGGHIVQGHVDCVGTIRRITEREGSWLFEVGFPVPFRRYLIPVGSVALDGISLTVASLSAETFVVSIIPHTFENTTLKQARKGQSVNLEFDLMGKYVEAMLALGPNGGGVTAEKLKQWGYEP